MAYDNPIILNNAGDDNYALMARDWTTNPVYVEYMRLMIPDESVLTQTLEIKSRTSFGSQYNRQISLTSYVNAIDKTNLTIVIPFNPVLIMDGNTYFVLKLPALSQVYMMFYYTQMQKF